jgi:hypothetical protein
LPSFKREQAAALAELDRVIEGSPKTINRVTTTPLTQAQAPAQAQTQAQVQAQAQVHAHQVQRYRSRTLLTIGLLASGMVCLTGTKSPD